MNTSLFLKEVLSLLAIVEPLGAIPIFLSLTSGMSERKQKVVARRAAMAGFLILFSISAGREAESCANPGLHLPWLQNPHRP